MTSCPPPRPLPSSERHPVVAGLLYRGGRGLLLHRSPTRRWYPDCWDLPGGHVAAAETSAAALRRELREELGVRAVLGREPFRRFRGEDLDMDVWVVTRWDREPANLDPTEHDALAWLIPRQMTGLHLADLRIPALFTAALRWRSSGAAEDDRGRRVTRRQP